jgi:hypothetical protein
MDTSGEITLWRAPSQACADPEGEVKKGFDPGQYPGQGLYLALFKSVAEGFQRCYGNGLQEMHLSKDVFEELVRQGIIRPDSFYPEGQSWHVLPDCIAAFNEAMLQGSEGHYHPSFQGVDHG